MKRESGSKKWKVQGPAITQWGCVRSGDLRFALPVGLAEVPTTSFFGRCRWPQANCLIFFFFFFWALAFDGGAI